MGRYKTIDVISKGDFRDLNVWKKCREIRKRIWRLCKTFPGEERHRLSDQLIRASRSATANIAEGYGRYHFQETIQFCRQARGSMYEIIDHLIVAEECGYTDSPEIKKLIQEITVAIKMLNGYIRYIRYRKDNQSSGV